MIFSTSFWILFLFSTLCSLVNSFFLLWSFWHFGENAHNAWSILGCLHQIPFHWRQQFRMSRFIESLEIDDGGDDRFERINGVGWL
jgi:hypothetical protein